MSEIEILVRYDHKRGCGWRQPGGKYLIGGKLCAPCGKLPHELTRCPVCNAGIKPMRGWQWVGARAIFDQHYCTLEEGDCDSCPLYDPPARAGLIWIGDTFYTPEEFVAESARLGISRRIAYVPKDFEVGKTLVLLASRKVLFVSMFDKPAAGCMGDLVTYKPAIFAAFVPTALEYVVRGSESEEELQRLVKQGFTLVRIERVGKGGGGDESGSEGARPGHGVRGPAAVWPQGHGTEDRPLAGGDMPGWIV